MIKITDLNVGGSELMNKPAWQETAVGMTAILTRSFVSLRKAQVRVV